MTDTIEISEDSLAAAMSFLVGPEYYVPSFKIKFEGYRAKAESRTVGVSRTFLVTLIDEVRSCDPFCDHAVNICSCGVLHALEELNLSLQGLVYCPECNGVGQVDSLEEDDYIRCPTCRGAGTVGLWDTETT